MAGAIGIKEGDIIPEGTFGYVPYTPELEDGVSAILDLISLLFTNSRFGMFCVTEAGLRCPYVCSGLLIDY